MCEHVLHQLRTLCPSRSSHMFGFQMQSKAVLQSTHFHSLQADAHALMPPKPIQLSLPGLPTES